MYSDATYVGLLKWWPGNVMYRPRYICNWPAVWLNHFQSSFQCWHIFVVAKTFHFFTIYLFFFCPRIPDQTKVKVKMLYASSKDSLKRALSGNVSFASLKLKVKRFPYSWGFRFVTESRGQQWCQWFIVFFHCFTDNCSLYMWLWMNLILFIFHFLDHSLRDQTRLADKRCIRPLRQDRISGQDWKGNCQAGGTGC